MRSKKESRTNMIVSVPFNMQNGGGTAIIQHIKKFENDCTNYISQCLHAGDAPMRGYPTKGKGWWMRNQNWSYSWTVANSLRWYIPNSTMGLRGRHVERSERIKAW